MCLLIVPAYTCAIKSNLIKEPEQKLITTKYQIPDANIPILFVGDDLELFENLKVSLYEFDRWIYENTREFIPFTDQ